ncbi:MAG: DMT family transporter [Candidatus Diapherotrites archaeon]|nr:DMT family transporter [Candidatus Diapherotrites archaeon]
MQIEFSVIIAFAAAVSWAFGDFFIQRTVRRIGNVESLFFIGIIGSIVLLPFAWETIALLSVTDIIFLAGMSLLTFIGAILVFEALKKGKLSVIDVLFEIELPVTIALAILFFRETLSLEQLGLIGTIFLGIILIAMQKFDFRKQLSLLEKGALFAVSGTIGIGFLNFFTAAAARSISPATAVWGPFFGCSLICLAVMAKRGSLKNLKAHAKKNKLNILGEGLFDTFAWTLFAVALAQESVAIVTAITESYPAIAVLLGVFINREKMCLHQYIGAGLALAACIVLGATA